MEPLGEASRQATIVLKVMIRVAAAVVVVAVITAGAAGFLVWWPVSEAHFRAEILHTIEASSGLKAEAEGPVSIILLPRPSVRLRTVHLEGAGHAVTVDAATVTGTLALTSMLSGRPRIVSTTLSDPTITIDLDRVLPMVQVSLLNDEPRAPETAAGPGILAFFRTDGLSLRSGVLRLQSSDPALDTMITDITATWEWPAGDNGPSLHGQMTWHGNPIEGAFLMDSPVALIRGGESRAYLKVRSPNLDLTADGTLSGRPDAPSSGRLTASTSSLPTFLRMIGTPLLPLDRIHEAQLSGDMTLSNRTLLISGARLALDDMSFDGAMAFHDERGHPGVAGTLATDQIDLEPFVKTLPNPFAADDSWSRAPFDTASVAYDDIDLRVSASRARMGKLLFEDGGLSLQSGGGRMEISLGEARAYDGLFKGRMVAQVEGDRTAIRADATFSQLNLKSLAADLDLPDEMSGTSTGHATLEGSGDSPASLIGSLTGRGQLSARNGEVGPMLVSALLRPASGSTPLPALLVGPAAFDSTLLGFDIKSGVASVSEGWLLRPDLRLVLGGSATLGAQRLDLDASLTPIGGDLSLPTGPRMTMSLTGPWRAPRLRYAEEVGDTSATPPSR